MDVAVIAPEELDRLVAALRRRGYAVAGPTVRDGAIVYAELEDGDDLPVGWTDRQDAGSYRLERRADEARFGYAVGPHYAFELRTMNACSAEPWLPAVSAAVTTSR